MSAIVAPERAAASGAKGGRKFLLVGVAALLALAAAGYGTYYTLVGRFFLSRLPDVRGIY